MLKNNSLYRFSIIVFFIIFLPLVQNQWQNLYLFEDNNFSFYKVLYYISGFIFPLIIFINSLNVFTKYKFKSTYKNKHISIRGKTLLVLVLSSILVFSKTIYNYFIINIDFLVQIFFENQKLLFVVIDKQIIFICVITIFLLIKKLNLLLKQILLLNCIICAIFIWYLQINSSLINYEFIINSYLNIKNLNIINVAFIALLEIMFYIWSYITDSTNLSDWKVQSPTLTFLKPIYKIIFFYLLICIYYLIV